MGSSLSIQILERDNAISAMAASNTTSNNSTSNNTASNNNNNSTSNAFNRVQTAREKRYEQRLARQQRREYEQNPLHMSGDVQARVLRAGLKKKQGPSTLKGMVARGERLIAAAGGFDAAMERIEAERRERRVVDEHAEYLRKMIMGMAIGALAAMEQAAGETQPAGVKAEESAIVKTEDSADVEMEAQAGVKMEDLADIKLEEQPDVELADWAEIRVEEQPEVSLMDLPAARVEDLYLAEEPRATITGYTGMLGGLPM